MSKSGVFIFGAGGHAKVVIDIIESQGLFDIKGIVDANQPVGSLHYGYEIIGSDNNISHLIESYQCNHGIIAIGSHEIRKTLVHHLNQNCPDFKFITAMHPSATIAKSVRIGDGSVVMPGVSINADAVIGQHCIINTNASVDHDCRIADYVDVAPQVGLAGNVTVGESVLLGVGACVIPGVTLADQVTIGAGALVLNDVPENSKALGIPAKIYP